MSRARASWTSIGLVVLAVVAVVLAYAALSATRGTVSPEPLASALNDPKDEKKSDEPLKQQIDRGDVVDALPESAEPPLLVVDAELAYRGTTGTCLGGATLERSVDGGARWRPVEVPAAAILTLEATGVDGVDVVGADDRCRTVTWSTTDRGETWSDGRRVTNVFARVPDDVRSLQTPTGVVRNPCPDRDVAPLAVEPISATEAAVLCVGGEVVTTSDGGASFQQVTPVVGGQALAFEGPSLGWVLQRDSGRCGGYQLVQTQDGGTTWQTGGCLGAEPISDPRSLPSLDFADPERGLANLAGEVFVSEDSGYTWRLAR
jgi:photosystem II stability/assembly factor-like uncharacterized protein